MRRVRITQPVTIRAPIGGPKLIASGRNPDVGHRHHPAIRSILNAVKRLLLSVAVLVAALVPGSSAARPPVLSPVAAGQISLKVGGKKLLTVAKLTRIAVGDPDVADIRAVGERVEVTGRSAGTTALDAWTQDGDKVSYVITVSR